MFAVVLEHLVLSFPTMFYRAVVPGHEGDRVPRLVPGIHVGNGVLAVEGDGLLSRGGKKLKVAQLVAVSLVVDIKAVVFHFSNPHIWFV